MANYDYDLIVIGGGGGGITATVLAVGLGKRVAMVDAGKFGGECTWSGCVPSKALLHAAKAAQAVGELAQYGIKPTGKIKLNTAKVMDNVRNIVNDIYKDESPAHFKKLGVKAVEDAGIRFIDKHTLSVNDKKMTAAKFLITTGSSPLVPPVPGLENVDYHTNETIFKIKKLPGSLVIMGGGPIGVELASAFNRLGVKVTLVEMADTILFREDIELARVVSDVLEKEGVTIVTGAKVVEVKGAKKAVVVYEQGARRKDLPAETILVATGRKPNTAGLGLETIGVAFDRSGIKVNSKLETTLPHIYAAGDVVGPYQFSHMANTQAIIAITNALLPITRKCEYSNVPWVTFTDPELARSGMTEREAREKHGNSIKVFRSEYKNTDRAKTDYATEGIAKVICKKNQAILGIHIAGQRAAELMQQLHMAKTLNVPLYKLNAVIYAYPGYSDVIKNLGRQAYVDKINSNPVVKLAKLFRSKK